MLPPDAPLASQHTSTLPIVLQTLPATLLVSTYQAGKLFLIRSVGEDLNVHFQDFDTPMGLAWDGGPRLAIGTRTGVWEYRNHPAAGPRCQPYPAQACWLPFNYRHTSHIAGHDLAWGTAGLWIVNTRFSCLCQLDEQASFRPVWKPPFLQELTPDDRCHVNGLALCHGEPSVVSALGTVDAPGGWRPQRATGGVLIDVPTGELIAHGLSMPHSPRWHDGELWFLESGRGALAKLSRSGQVETVCVLPGFTRGLDLAGPYAFVGLSQVRDSNQFAGLPITERLRPDERACGVWVVDTRTAAVVAFLRFTSGVQEIFAVQVLRGWRSCDLISEPTNDLFTNSFLLDL